MASTPARRARRARRTAIPRDSHVPVRTCVGCRRRRPQAELVRVVLTVDGRAQLSRRAPGRGAWLCRPPGECAELALRRKGFERAWRQTVPDAARDDVRSLTGPWDEQKRKVE